MIADLSGKKFGRLTVMKLCERFSDEKVAWLCKCDCGNLKKVRATHLSSGLIRSCGCLRKEGSHTTHGHSKHSRLYRIWGDMKTRCYNPNGTGYSRYGGRGIQICDEWRNNFQSFYDWALANGYSDALSIDRKDVNGGYYPENCRWETKHVQSINKTNNLYVTFHGKKITVSELAEQLNVSPYTLYSRLNKLHWNVEDMIAKIPNYANGTRRAKQNDFN